MKRALLIFVVTLLVFSSTTIISGAKPENTPKEEVVYGMLDDAGGLKSLSVVNGFDLEKDATVADYGTYASVANLTSEAKITQSGNFLHFQGKSGRTYYQGVLKNRQLPWNIKITCYLNGKSISPQALNGKSGKLKIAVATSRNSNEKGSFFDDFSLQVTVPMKMALCQNINTKGATVADVGSTRQFSYVVLPGKNGSIALSADVSNFEMDAITIAGIRMTFDLPLDVKKIDQSLSQLVNATVKLDGGALKLVSGAKALQSGMQQYTNGFKLLNSQLGKLQTGASSLEAGIISLGSGLQSLSDQGASLRAGASSIQTSVFDAANAQLTGMGIPPLAPDNYKAILSSLPSNPMIDSLMKQLDDITAFVTGIDSYTLGTTQLAGGASGLSSGAGALSDGITTLADGLNKLYGSTVKLNNGMKAFLEGVSAYRTGTKAFRVETSQMEKQMGSQLDSLLSLLSSDGQVYHSYVSDENSNVNFVQFIMKTEGINIETTAPATEPTVHAKSLWEKFLDLFR
jgi:putative membrane protein